MLAYLLAHGDFTRANAWNALNWHVFVLSVGVVALGIAFGLGSVPESFVIVGAAVGVGIVLLNFVCCLVAAVKAARGTAWGYPLAPGLV